MAALRERVHVHTDDAQHKDSRAFVLTLRDGRTLDRHIADNLGTPDNPMSDEQLEEKFIGLAAPVLGVARAKQVANERCSSFPDIRAPINLKITE